MEHKPCFGKKPLNEPETVRKRGCVKCPDWNSCLSVTWITDGLGPEAWLAKRKMEKEKNHEENSHPV